MVDTIRTLTELTDTLFPDGQAAGSITPQDMRDLIVSIGKPPYGGMYTLVAAETDVAVAGTYLKMAGTTQSNNLRGFDMPVDNRLRYTGTIPYHMHIACSIAMTAAGNNKLLGFKLYLYDDSAGSGAVIDGSRAQRKIGTGADIGSTALHWDVMMDTNDYLELWLTNDTDTTDATVTNLYMFAMGMLV